MFYRQKITFKWFLGDWLIALYGNIRFESVDSCIVFRHSVTPIIFAVTMRMHVT